MIQGLYDLQWVAWLLWTCFLTGWREDISYLVGLVEDRGEMVLVISSAGTWVFRRLSVC